MWLCLSCFHLSPAGRYCAFCGKSRGRVCKKGHVNAAFAKHCAACGSSLLTQPTPWIPLGWVSVGLAVLATAILVRAGLSQACLLLCFGWRFGNWALRFVVANAPACLRQLLSQAAGTVVLLLVLSLFLPAQTGAALRRLIVRGILSSSTYLWKLGVGLLGAFVVRRPSSGTDTGKRT
jgi:hypothetical protein